MRRMRKGVAAVTCAICVASTVFVGSFIAKSVISKADNMEIKVGDLTVSVPEEMLAAKVNSFLNIRYQPSSSSTIIGELKPGDTVTYLETLGEWTKVDVNGQIGYVYTKYALTGNSLKKYIKNNLDKFSVEAVQTEESFSKVYKTKKGARADAATYEMNGKVKKTATIYATKSSAQTIKNEYETVKKAVVNVQALRLRENASTKSPIKAVLSKGTYLTIVSDAKKDWMKVKYDGKIGFVSKDYIRVANVKQNKSNIVKTVKKDTKLNVEQVEKNWVQVSCDGVKNYMKREYCNVSAQTDDKKVTGLLENNVSCKIKNVQDDIALVTLKDGSQGYTKCANLKAQISIDGVKINEAAVNAEQKKIEEKQNIQIKNDGKVSKKRTDIVNYALKFVGNPYKWGGNSLTEGTDCSGFVNLIYKKYGYNLARCSWLQAQNGKEISFSELQPGDLIFYYDKDLGRIGHVAIYMGNNKIVHAKSTKAGITTNEWNYRTPYKAVNVID